MDYGHWDITEFGEFDPSDFFGFIYEIEEIATGRCYIGKKFFRHKRKKTKADKSKTKESDWKEYTSSCEPLKESIEQQGKDKFTFRIVSLCSGRCQLTYEENQLQFTKDVLRSRLPNGERKYFNKTIGHLLFAGVEKQTEATKEKMRATQKRVKNTPESKETNRQAQLIVQNRPEIKEANRVKMLGNKCRLGIPHTPETLEKIRIAAIGRIKGPKTRQKMRLARLAYWANKRAKKS